MTDSNTELLIVDVQNALEETDSEEPPASDALSKWARCAFAEVAQSTVTQASEVTLRLVEAKEMIELNSRFRNKNTVTNVLSFPVEYNAKLNLESRLLGDIVLCHPVIVSEAHTGGRSLAERYAHMVTHGVLHLLDFDHQDEQSASEMEFRETSILALSGISDPYALKPAEL